MPPAESLPEAVRALARKQAVHLRDDAWDHDVDRLVSAIAEVTRTPVTPPSLASPPAGFSLSPKLKVGAALVVVAILTFFMLRRDSPPDAPSVASTANASSAATPTTSTSTSAAAAVRGQPYGVALPRIAEVAHRSLIFTILSASVVPLGGGTSELRLRVRFSNEGRYDANAWDDSFRLVVGGITLAPTSRLNELARGHSLMQGIVTFEIPANAGKATLQVIEGRRTGELSLDLSATSRPAEDEKADAGDALSRATVRSIAGTPVALVRDGDLSVAIERATSRRFVNVVRLRLGLRFSNTGRYAASAYDATLRVAAGDEVLAPIDSPGVLVEGNSNAAAEVEFEVPPTVTRVVLRGTIRNSTGEWPLELQ